MANTVSLICKTQEDLNFFLENGYKIKKTKDGLEYLVKEENSKEEQ